MAYSSEPIGHKPSAISQADLFKVAPRWMPPGFDEAKLTTEESSILSFLKTVHVGHRRAIPARELAVLGGGDTRKIRAILKHLTEDHHIGIASSVTPPYGIFLINDEDEAIDYCKQLHGRAMLTLKREAVIRRMTLPALLGQMRLEIEDGGSGG